VSVDPGPFEAASRPRVQSAARTVAILLAVAQSERGLTPREVSEQVGIGRQAAYHLLHTLTGTGMLMRDDGNRYVLGLRVGTLAAGFARQLAPAERLAPLVRAVAQQTGETAYAAGWVGEEIATLAITPGTNPVQASGAPRPFVGNAHARASGKLLLAFAPAGARGAYLDRHGVAPVAEKTTTDRAALERELDAIRRQAYAFDDEEFAAGLCCLAVPLDAGHSPFVLALSAPRERFVAERERYLATLRDVVATVGGGSPAAAPAPA
jgi:IclR family transcriptional regulator, acetate operon repressor